MDKLYLVNIEWQDQLRSNLSILLSMNREEDKTRSKGMRRVLECGVRVQRRTLVLRLLLMVSKEDINTSNNLQPSNSSLLPEVLHLDHLRFIRITATDQSLLRLINMLNRIMLLDPSLLHLSNTALDRYHQRLK